MYMNIRKHLNIDQTDSRTLRVVIVTSKTKQTEKLILMSHGNECNIDFEHEFKI